MPQYASPRRDANKLTDSYKMTGETGSYRCVVFSDLCDLHSSSFILTLCFRYMAGEVFRHQPYNETVDIYSYGMIFYYILAGVKPWPTLNAVDACVAAALEGRRPYIPRSWNTMLCTLIQGCWNAHPYARPSFKEIIDVLEEYTISKKYGTCGFVESLRDNMTGIIH